MTSAGPRWVLVIVPTYNERDSIPGALARLAQHVPDADVLVVDDGSPDGTADLVAELAAADCASRGREAIHLMRRTAKQGLGPAYIAGFRWGMERGYGVLVEMDADGSHRAEDLPALLARTDEADLVIGSRWVRGGRVVNWPLHRLLLSRGANVYTRLATGLPVHDATAGFRAYSSQLLERLPLGEVASHGYGFQIDMTLRAVRAGARVVEVPITFVEREQGVSKMSNAIIGEAMLSVARWGTAERSRQLAGAFGRLSGRRAAGSPSGARERAGS